MEAANSDPPKKGLEDPRALQILTVEHWSLLSTRALGYQEVLGRATIFIAALSGVVVALALLAQATNFGRHALYAALLLISVMLFLGVATFVRSVAINADDARWVTGMNLLRRAYLQIVPELEPFFVTGHDPKSDRRALRHGSRQVLVNLANSLTTTSSVVAALNSVLVGALVSDLGALLRASPAILVSTGATISVVSAVVHVRYAARFRETHSPTTRPNSTKI